MHFQRITRRVTALRLAFALFLSAPVVAIGAISGVSQVAFFDDAPPLVTTFAPGDPDVLFVGLRNGQVRVVDRATGEASPEPYLTVDGVDDFLEGGLLGLAFHPDYANNGKVYALATLDPGDASPGFFDPFVTTVLEYTVSESDPYRADPTPRVLLEIPQSFANHNGGWIGFNPAAAVGEESYLHLAVGDDEHPEFTQSVSGNLKASILRIDVDRDAFPDDPNRNYAIPATNPFVGVEGEDEVYAFGLRNPYRASFDRLTGDLWIGDVGDGAREEIDVLRSADGGGQNFGWNACEGLLESSACTALRATPGVELTDPVYDYSRNGDPYSPEEFRGVSVTGGVVYRGPDPELQGTYIFGDVFPSAGAHAFWSLDAADPVGSIATLQDDLFPEGFNSAGSPVSFGEDAHGNLYFMTYLGDSGGLFRIETDAQVTGDFNADGRVDAADYVVWRDTLGDAASYGHWAANHGRTAQDLSHGVATPEPTSQCLVAAAVLLLGGRARTSWRPREAV